MGQKVHPTGFRLGQVRTWDAKWFARKREYADLLHEDLRIREHLDKGLQGAGISRVSVDRAGNKVRVNIYTARPGIIIGKRGAEVNRLKEELEELTGKQIYLNIQEVKNPDIDPKLIGESVGLQLSRRVSHRRAMKQGVNAAMQMGAKGVRIACSGRLGGSEMSRSEWYRQGKVPMQTMRADIRYAQTEGQTAYGPIGVKVWVYLGEVPIGQDAREQEELSHVNA